MTEGERIGTAVFLSLAFHYLLLAGFAPPPKVEVAGDDLIVVDFAAPNVALSLAAPITLEEAAPAEESSAQASADRRRQALALYLDAVSEAVHAHRQASGSNRGLAGNARFAVTIDGQGAFHDVHLLQSSGDATLDRDARHAIEEASGTVPRPGMLGRQPLHLDLRVKYQFGL